MFVFLQGKIFKREFYNHNTLTVASELLGCILVVLNENTDLSKNVDGEICLEEKDVFSAGKIVETEGYLGLNDKACHSYKAKANGRTNIMYGQGGFAYVYLIYGLHHCFNVVTQNADMPEAVLIRALEPLNSTEDIKKYSGPGKLCKQTGITKNDYGADLCAETPSRIIIIKPNNYAPPQITSSKRIGVDYSEEAKDFLYRFYDANSKSVSKMKGN